MSSELYNSGLYEKIICFYLNLRLLSFAIEKMCIRDRFSSVVISSDKVGVKMGANKTTKTGNINVLS